MFGSRDTESLVQAAARFGVDDERVLAAMRRIDRADFVPEGRGGRAYRDRPVPIAHSQTTSQPSLIAKMVATLELDGSGRVLEIGTGLGYQTALLAQLAEHVWSIERFEDLADEARSNLRQAGIDNVTVIAGDGTNGHPEEAPYRGIIVAAAHEQVPAPLSAQLADGGRLVQPVGPGGMEQVIVYTSQEGDLRRLYQLTGASFVRLRGEHGYSD